MNDLVYILANDKDISYTKIIAVIILVVISILGNVLQKAKEKKEREQRAGKSPRPQPKPPSPPVRKQPQMRQAVQQRRQASQPSVPPLTAAQKRAIRVREELKLQQARQRKAEAQRRKRLAARKSPEEDSAAIEKRLVHVNPSIRDEEKKRPKEAIGLAQALRSRSEARRAIILHEVLSSPKGLRKGPEMWDS